jgi:phosphate starvation-inducible protein PhoH and related proteins
VHLNNFERKGRSPLNNKEIGLSKRKNRALAQVVDNTVDFQSYRYKKYPQLIPKSVNQETYIEMLTNNQLPVVIAAGPAGTGKTMMAVMAAIQAYKNGTVEKIVITRPAVGVDNEQHGFLPGDLNSKMEPWTRPIFDVLHEYYSPKDTAGMLAEQRIEISPLAYMRGRTFKNAWIIFDEAQNSTENQMKMVLTRLGEGSKMVITGDLAQHDRKFQGDNGFRDFIARLDHAPSQLLKVVQFGPRDIQRHPVVSEVLRIYGDQ